MSRPTEPKQDVALVQMPYSAVCRPSLALSLLKVYLEQVGIASRVVYGNLRFAEEIGLDLYRLVEDTSATRLVGEWTFSAAAFPDFTPDRDTFLALVDDTLHRPLSRTLTKAHPGITIADVLDLVRQRAKTMVDSLADELVASGPRIVACSSMFQQHCASLALLRAIKERDPSIVTMLGGANCEGPMGLETHRAFPWVDVVASGEADGYFGDLCRDLLTRGEAIPTDELPYGVWGPAHRRARAEASDAVQNGTELPPPPSGEARAVVRDLDAIATPDFSDYFDSLKGSAIESYVYPGLPIETSRGCWWGEKRHCTFCGLNGSGMVFRSKSAERTLDELATLSSRYDVRRIGVVDNILDMAFTRSVLPELVAAGAPYTLFYEVKPNLRREQVELFADAGLRWIQPGIESMHTEMLTLLRKGSTGVQNVQLLKWGLELGLRISWNNLYGAPGEDDAWFEETAAWLPLIVHLQPPAGSCPIHFDRFSPYHDQSDAFGLDLEPLAEYGHVYPLATDGLARLAYFFRARRQDGCDTDPTPPGAGKVAAIIAWWRQHFWQRERPVLEIVSDDSQTMTLRDTRPHAHRAEHVLEGVEAAILRTCEKAVSPAQLAKRLGLATNGAGPTDHPAVRRLVEDRLLLHLDGRLLTLAIQPPKRPLPTFEDAPTGMMNDAAIVRDFMPTSLAKRCLRSPLDIPLGAFVTKKKPSTENRVDG